MQVISETGIAIEVLRGFHEAKVDVDVWDNLHDERVLNLELTLEQASMVAAALQAAVAAKIAL